MPKPLLCWVTSRVAMDTAPHMNQEAALVEQIREGIRAGIDWIQIREKDLETPRLMAITHQALMSSRNTGTRVIVNDRLDIAWAAGAAGVHLGDHSIPISAIAAVSQCLPSSGFLVGASCHSLADSIQAAKDGADYVFFGPVFATPSKAAYGPPQGLARLEEVCRLTPIPVLAIGGITKENAASCIKAGATGIAAIRLFQGATDLSALLYELRRGLA